MLTDEKLNPIETHLVNNGYELQPKNNEYAKPRYRKGDDEVIVCWHCGWITVNGVMKRFATYSFNKQFLNLIP